MNRYSSFVIIYIRIWHGTINIVNKTEENLKCVYKNVNNFKY